MPTIIKVKDGGAAYTTNTIQGKKASSTHSAEMAALRLAEKLRDTGEAASDVAVCVQQLIDANLPVGVTRWEVLREAVK